MVEDDNLAIAQLKRGEIIGLQTLVDRYQQRAVHAAYLITLDWTLAEDVVQDAFLRSYHRITQFDSSRAFGPWFLRGVVNDAVKRVSRNRLISLTDAVAEYHDPNTPDPAGLIEAAETRDAVQKALEQLPAPQRAAIVLCYYLDLSEAEIAHELDCAPGTVKWRLHVARQQLAVLLRWMKS